MESIAESRPTKTYTDDASTIRRQIRLGLLGYPDISDSARSPSSTLVLAVLFIDQHHYAAGADLGDDFRDRAEGGAFAFHDRIIGSKGSRRLPLKAEKGPGGPFRFAQRKPYFGASASASMTASARSPSFSRMRALLPERSRR